MCSYVVGDLVWIPANTTNYMKNVMIGREITGPACGLVIEIIGDLGTQTTWLRVAIGKDIYVVAAEKTRKIEI